VKEMAKYSHTNDESRAAKLSIKITLENNTKRNRKVFDHFQGRGAKWGLSFCPCRGNGHKEGGWEKSSGALNKGFRTLRTLETRGDRSG